MAPETVGDSTHTVSWSVRETNSSPPRTDVFPSPSPQTRAGVASSLEMTQPATMPDRGAGATGHARASFAAAFSPAPGQPGAAQGHCRQGSGMEGNGGALERDLASLAADSPLVHLLPAGWWRSLGSTIASQPHSSWQNPLEAIETWRHLPKQSSASDP